MNNPDVTSPAPSAGIVDMILEAFHSTEDTVEVPVMDKAGNVVCAYHVRKLKSFADLEMYKAKAAAFIAFCTRKDGHHEAWKPFVPMSAKEAAAAYAIHYFSAEPQKVLELDAMRLVKLGNPWIVESLIAAINENQVDANAVQFVESVDAEKNESGVTPSTGSGLASPETSTENTTGE